MSRMLYFLVIGGIMAFVLFILDQAFTDPAAFAANQQVYIFWAVVIVAATLLISCLSSGRWMLFGAACLALGAWYIFRLQGGAIFIGPAR